MEDKYGEEIYYNKHPVITEKLAEFLIKKKIKMLGIDMPSPDYFPFDIHKLLLSNNIFIMENLKNLDKLIKANKFEVYAFPLKIQAESSPVRAVAKIIL
jgi:kynurenine formamidase